MTAKIRKYVLPNIPYLFAFWFCLKLGTAYRMASGANIGMRLINVGATLSVALETISPGANPNDWLVGVAGAVLLRIVIYHRVKNAKKFRRNVEYGSARWGA